MQEELPTVVDFWADELDYKIAQYLKEKEGSNVAVEFLSGFYINCAQNEHLIRLGAHVDYPEGLRGKDLVFNTKGEANICLMQCLAAYKCLARGMDLRNICKRCVHASWCLRHINWSVDINFSVTFENITKVQKMNPVRIYVYSPERGDITR